MCFKELIVSVIFVPLQVLNLHFWSLGKRDAKNFLCATICNVHILCSMCELNISQIESKKRYDTINDNILD
jgi:hypothetical protein